ncbi:MAG TPA: hypothetical protein VK845_13000 [Gemmatimonadales bacterium]|nr:hypothetical protein [Gemmatimonadales bacterium]
MVQHELAQRVQDLKNALTSIETEVKGGKTRPEGLEDLKAVVDNVRLSLWAILSSAQADDYEAFIGAFRLRRATDICQQVLADIRAGNMNGASPEFVEFKGTVEELASATTRR